MASLKLILRRARTLLWTALSILIVFAATLVGVGKLLMPYSEHYQPRLEAWLSQEFGQKVTLESFSGEWNAFGPRLSLQGLRLQAGEGESREVAIAQAALDLKPLNALIPGRALYNFLVIGADFKLTHSDQGQYELSGFGVGGTDGNEQSFGLRNLIGIGELILEDSNLQYIDERQNVRLTLTAIDARLQLDGDSVSMELDAKLTEETSGHVYGEVDASGLLDLADNTGLKQARWQVTVRELLLSSLQGKLPPSSFLPQEGRINAELWCDWAIEKPLQVQGVLDLRNGRIVMEEQELKVAHLNTRLAWEFDGKGDWRLDLDGLLFDDGEHSWTAPGIAVARDLDKDLGLWVSADYLPLDVPIKLTRNIMASYSTAWPAFLPGSAIGAIDGLELVLDGNWRLKLARGTAQQVGISDWGKWPDLLGINGTINLGQGYGNLSLQTNRLDVLWPQMFRDPLTFRLPECDLDLAWGVRWQVIFRACGLENDDLAVSGDVLVASNEGRPAVDVNVQFEHMQIAQLAPYWPQEIMSENILNWLRRGLLGGEVVNGRFQIHGDMDDWPFRHGEGRFEAVAVVNDGELEYVPDWPRAYGIDAIARFTGPSMSIEGAIDNIGSVEVQTVSANIADFKTPLLLVNYNTQSTLDALVAFLIQSPLDKQFDSDLSRYDFSGVAGTSGLLRIPIGITPGELEIEGRADLQANRFYDPTSDVVLDEINGTLQYSQNGVKGSGLKTLFKDKPAVLDLAGNRDGSERFRVDVAGAFNVQEILPGFLLKGYADLDRVQGLADWLVSVVIPAEQPGLASGAELVIRSDLIGIAVDLPDPLSKTAGETWPLLLRYPLTGPTPIVDLELPGRIQVLLEIPRSAAGNDGDAAISRALLRMGDGPAELPPLGSIRIDGSAKTFNLDGWVDLIIDWVSEGKSLTGLQLERCELAAGQLRFLNRMFDEVNLSLNFNQADLNAVISGADIAGNVEFTADSGSVGSLSANFERLVLAKPISSGVDMKSNPGDLPALHLYAKSFRYADIEMGETRIEAYPTSTSFHFEKVEAESDQLSIRASGDWSLTETGQKSIFKIFVTSESLGQLMQSLDISTSLEGGQTMLHFDAWWPGSPANFALSRLNGEIKFNVSQGQITNASAGGGRILGLLSIQALPRRLALDFRDVFDTGFVFEEANGTFHMENGMATTDDIALSSSAAKISVSGSTDLVAQEYNQLMTIRPGLGNTLPIIGALAGGPGGAAAGLALQGLLQKQLGEASQVQYTITGSWDEPLIEPVLKGQSGG